MREPQHLLSRILDRGSVFRRRTVLAGSITVVIFCTAAVLAATIHPASRSRTDSTSVATLGPGTTTSGRSSASPASPAADPTSLPTHVAPSSTLPGEQIWANGASSLLFGINDTYDWAGNNLENTPAAQAALKSAGFTLVRSFFSEQHIGWPFGHSLTTDSDLELRFRTIENVGATCLGVLAVSGNAQYDSSLQFLDHVLTYAETSKPGHERCQIWEYGNEPYTNMSQATYLQRWNHDIPILRAKHPQAKFVGLVDAGPYFNHIQDFLNGVKQSGVLPDAISYHDYPCYNQPDYPDTAAGAQACDKIVNSGGNYTPSYKDRIVKIKGMVRATLGRNLPVGITEWNVSPNFVQLVNGQLPLTMSPTYQPHFIQELYAAMAAGGLDFATEFDAMSGAGAGGTVTTPSGPVELSLDLVDSNANPRPWFSAYQSTIARYKGG